jgi:chromosome partitioning protein
MRSIAVVNLKGGSGKTTTALCLAIGMARRGRRTLLIDADPQANATMTMLDGAPAEPPTLGNVLMEQAGAAEAIRPTRVAGLEILPADARLADAALLLADQMGREHRLRAALEELEGRHDVLVIDCPPQMSLVVVNVLAAVAELVVPVDAGIYSVAGLAQLQQAVEDVRRYLGNVRLHLAGLVLTRAHHNRATRDIEAQLRAAYGPLVCRSVIPHSVKVEEAHARHRTIPEFAPASGPAKAYDDLVSEVIDRGDHARDTGPAVHADPAHHAGDAA